MTPVNPKIARAGHIIQYRYQNYTQIVEITPYVLNDITCGSPNYFYMPITRGFLNHIKAGEIEKDMYQIFLTVLYNFRTKATFHGSNPLFKMEFIHQYQDLYIILKGEPAKIEFDVNLFVNV